MMKQYNITVNGTTYAVEVEEVGGASMPSAPRVQAAPVAPAPAAAPAPAPKVVSAPAAAPVTAGGELIVAPMPGTIFDIPVVVGQAVKAGDNLIILEAMKMENEIVAPVDGTVKTIHVTKGTSVSSGDALITLG
jgi:biotin carboxyl carrier protein